MTICYLTNGLKVYLITIITHSLELHEFEWLQVIRQAYSSVHRLNENKRGLNQKKKRARLDRTI